MYTNLCIPCCIEVSYVYQPLYFMLSRGQLYIPTSVFQVVFKVSYVYQPLYSRLSRGQLCIPTSVNTSSSCLHVVSFNIVNNINNNNTNKFPSFTSNAAVVNKSQQVVNSILGLSINNDTEKIVIARGKQENYKSRSNRLSSTTGGNREMDQLCTMSQSQVSNITRKTKFSKIC